MKSVKISDLAYEYIRNTAFHQRKTHQQVIEDLIAFKQNTPVTYQTPTPLPSTKFERSTYIKNDDMSPISGEWEEELSK